MYREPKELKVFTVADDFAYEMHASGRDWAREGRDSLAARLERAALAPALHILEACRQPRDEAFAAGLQAARRAAEEARYLLDLARRVGLLTDEAAQGLEDHALHLVKSLAWLLKYQRERERRRQEAGAGPAEPGALAEA